MTQRPARHVSVMPLRKSDQEVQRQAHRLSGNASCQALRNGIYETGQPVAADFAWSELKLSSGIVHPEEPRVRKGPFKVTDPTKVIAVWIKVR